MGGWVGGRTELGLGAHHHMKDLEVSVDASGLGLHGFLLFLQSVLDSV